MRNVPGPAGRLDGITLSMSAETGVETDSMLTPGRALNVGWSGDSRGVLYLDGTDPVQNVCLQRFGGAAAVHLTNFTEGQVLSCVSSPDGRKIAISRQVGSSANVWVSNADGSHRVQVSHFADLRVFLVEWMPDSRRVAIGAGTSNRDAVLVRKFR